MIHDMRCLLIGNYGVGNIGDEALREYFETTFKDIDWLVMTAHGKGEREVCRMPFGLRSFFRPWWRTIAQMRRCDAVIYGGGSLFTDVESAKACGIWWWQAVWARMLGVPVLMAFQGVGPVNTRLGCWLTQWVLCRCVFLSVRDEKSVERAYKVAGPVMTIKVVQSFDPVFGLLLRKKSQRTQKLLIIPRANSTSAFFEEAVQAAHQRTWQEVSILLMHPQSDRPVAEMLIEKLKPLNVKVVDVLSLTQLAEEVATGELVITQRYHGGIAALALDVPFMAVSQSEGDKLESLRGLQAEKCGQQVAMGEQALRDALNTLRR
jgi:polysaccharide pyruvyl transferase WcaK-like protein